MGFEGGDVVQVSGASQPLTAFTFPPSLWQATIAVRNMTPFWLWSWLMMRSSAVAVAILHRCTSAQSSATAARLHHPRPRHPQPQHHPDPLWALHVNRHAPHALLPIPLSDKGSLPFPATFAHAAGGHSACQGHGAGE